MKMDITYDYYFNYDLMKGLENTLATVDQVYNVGMFLLGIVCYVLGSIGMYSIAKRRGISHAWLAWVPVVNVWVLGSISDQFRYVTKAQVKNKRTTLLVMNLVYIVVVIALIAVLLMGAVDLVTMGMAVAPNEEELMASALALLFQFLGFFAIIVVLAIILAVFRFIALYDLYVSVNPSCAVLFLVLSVFLGVTQPFFIFFNRKNDDGMPPRCDVPQEPVAYTETDYIPVSPAPAEPWENNTEE